jgi:ATP-dependent Clp protease ATP-binding subunit ClpC
MENKMQRFSQSARRVLSYAQEEAEYLQNSVIGSEHILVGLVREEHGIAGKVLRDLGAGPGEVLALVEAVKRSSEPRMSSAPPELSVGVKRLLQTAAAEASRTEHPTIHTGHLLIGLLRQTESAAEVLRHLKVNPSTALQRVQQEIEQGADDANPA